MWAQCQRATWSKLFSDPLSLSKFKNKPEFYFIFWYHVAQAGSWLTIQPRMTSNHLILPPVPPKASFLYWIQVSIVLAGFLLSQPSPMLEMPIPSCQAIIGILHKECFLGLERWLNWKHLLISQRTWVWSPEPVSGSSQLPVTPVPIMSSLGLRKSYIHKHVPPHRHRWHTHSFLLWWLSKSKSII